MTDRTRRRIAMALAVLSALVVLVLFWSEGRREAPAADPARPAGAATATTPGGDAYRRLQAADRRYADALDAAERDYFEKKADIERRGAPASELRAAQRVRFQAIQAAGRQHDAAGLAYAETLKR